MRENAIYTVTPPDIMLPESGPIVTVVSSNKSFVAKIESLYEDIFKSVSVKLYHPNGKVTESNSAWIISMIRFSDTVYVDMDDVNELSLSLVLLSNKTTIFVNQNQKKKGLIKILNTMTINEKRFTIVDCIEEYRDLVMENVPYA